MTRYVRRFGVFVLAGVDGEISWQLRGELRFLYKKISA